MEKEVKNKEVKTTPKKKVYFVKKVEGFIEDDEIESNIVNIKK